MPWISAAAMRGRLRQTSRQHLQDQLSGKAPKTVDHMTVTDAFIGGDADTMRMAAENAAANLPWMEKRVPLTDAASTANYLNLSIATHYAGADIGPRIQHLLKAKPGKDAVTVGLRWIAERIAGTQASTPKVSNPPDWLASVLKAPAADALDRVLIPEDKDFADMQRFVLPLSLLLESTGSTPFHIYTRDGGHPERRGNVLYERNATTSAATKADEQGGITWVGFDAVERKGDGLFAYFYLNQKWHAPISFQPGIDAMPFLHDLQGSWKIVEQSIDPEQWNAIRLSVDAGDVTYVIAHDPVRAPLATGALENAASKYGIKVIAAPFMTV